MSHQEQEFVQHPEQNLQGVNSVESQIKAVQHNKEIEGMLGKALKAAEKRSCSNCGHIEVCTVFRALTGLLGPQNFTDESKPFNAEDVGYICRKWFSALLLKTLNGGAKA